MSLLTSHYKLLLFLGMYENVTKSEKKRSSTLKVNALAPLDRYHIITVRIGYFRDFRRNDSDMTSIRQGPVRPCNNAAKRSSLALLQYWIQLASR